MYTFWDFLGDVGGLHDMLKLLGEFLMTIITMISGSGLERYLIANLFKVDPKKTEKQVNYESNQIARRKPARFSLCNCLCSWRDSVGERLLGVAEERISRELDIVTFLRHQMIDDVARRLLFTRMERYLIRNQAKPFVL